MVVPFTAQIDPSMFTNVVLSIDEKTRCRGTVYVRLENGKSRPEGPLGITVISPSLPYDIFFSKDRVSLDRSVKDSLDTVILKYERGSEEQNLRFVFLSGDSKQRFFEFFRLC